MTYKPPFARMRQIRKSAPAPLSRHPANVEEALQAAIEAQEAGEEVADEIRVPVGAIDAVITPGDDKVFGTEDDEVRLEGHKDDGKHEHEDEEGDEPEPWDEPSIEIIEPEVEIVEDKDEDEDEPVEDDKPSYDMTMKKDELIALAEKYGLDSDGTKAEIIARLDDRFAS